MPPRVNEVSEVQQDPIAEAMMLQRRQTQLRLTHLDLMSELFNQLGRMIRAYEYLYRMYERGKFN